MRHFVLWSAKSPIVIVGFNLPPSRQRDPVPVHLAYREISRLFVCPSGFFFKRLRNVFVVSQIKGIVRGRTDCCWILCVFVGRWGDAMVIFKKYIGCLRRQTDGGYTMMCVCVCFLFGLLDKLNVEGSLDGRCLSRRCGKDKRWLSAFKD